MSGTASASYTYNPSLLPGLFPASLVRSTDGAFIPCDPANSDYQRFLQAIADGMTPPEGWTGPTNETP